MLVKTADNTGTLVFCPDTTMRYILACNYEITIQRDHDPTATHRIGSSGTYQDRQTITELQPQDASTRGAIYSMGLCDPCAVASSVVLDCYGGSARPGMVAVEYSHTRTRARGRQRTPQRHDPRAERADPYHSVASKRAIKTLNYGQVASSVQPF